MNLITDSDELRARIREASEWSDMTHVEGDLDDIINAIIAAGWRLVPEGSVVVSREDALDCRAALSGAMYSRAFFRKKYQATFDRLDAALESVDE